MYNLNVLAFHCTGYQKYLKRTQLCNLLWLMTRCLWSLDLNGLQQKSSMARVEHWVQYNLCVWGLWGRIPFFATGFFHQPCGEESGSLLAAVSTHTASGPIACNLLARDRTHCGRGRHNRMDAASLLALKVALWMREPCALFCLFTRTSEIRAWPRWREEPERRRVL